MRHAQSCANAAQLDKLMTLNIDDVAEVMNSRFTRQPLLTYDGMDQALAAGRQLVGQNIREVQCSVLPRAAMTAACVVAALGVEYPLTDVATGTHLTVFPTPPPGHDSVQMVTLILGIKEHTNVLDNIMSGPSGTQNTTTMESLPYFLTAIHHIVFQATYQRVYFQMSCSGLTDAALNQVGDSSHWDGVLAPLPAGTKVVVSHGVAMKNYFLTKLQSRPPHVHNCGMFYIDQDSKIPTPITQESPIIRTFVLFHDNTLAQFHENRDSAPFYLFVDLLVGSKDPIRCVTTRENLESMEDLSNGKITFVINENLFLQAVQTETATTFKPVETKDLFTTNDYYEGKNKLIHRLVSCRYKYNVHVQSVLHPSYQHPEEVYRIKGVPNNGPLWFLNGWNDVAPADSPDRKSLKLKKLLASLSLSSTTSKEGEEGDEGEEEWDEVNDLEASLAEYAVKTQSEEDEEAGS
jgi:hypothetical protein